MKPIARRRLGRLVESFLSELHRFDAGRTLPLLHAARLTTPQLATLELARQPHTVSAVASHLGLSRPATSQLIDKLVRGRLLRRMEGKVDRRERSVVLTARGVALLGRIARARAERFEAALTALPAPVAARLERALADVIIVLGGAGS